MSFNESFIAIGRASAPSSAHAKGQVKRGERGQQWYGRPAGVFFEDNPCHFNTIGGVTGTQRARKSRTKEQGPERGWQSQAMIRVVPPKPSGMPKAPPGKPSGIQKAYFAGDGGSVRMRSLVWRHFEQETQAQIKTEAGRKMALKCEFCGKAPHFGNVISHANNTRRRRWNPNLKRLRAVVAGVRKQVRVCTACIRAGKVKKAA